MQIGPNGPLSMASHQLRLFELRGDLLAGVSRQFAGRGRARTGAGAAAFDRPAFEGVAGSGRRAQFDFVRGEERSVVVRQPEPPRFRS